jgi:hypothetical protein
VAQNIVKEIKQYQQKWLQHVHRGELSYLAPLGSEKISAPYFKQYFFRGGGRGVITHQAESNTTPPSPKTEITNILRILYVEFCINNKI